VRKGLIIGLLAVFGFAMTSDAQAPVKPRNMIVKAKSAKARTSDATLFTGNVSISISGAVVTADEAVVDRTGNEVQLQGNVRLRLIEPPAK
jgi:lipopolysaccharide assembly outer membrane protein LptD (OstA)